MRAGDGEGLGVSALPSSKKQWLPGRIGMRMPNWKGPKDSGSQAFAHFYCCLRGFQHQLSRLQDPMSRALTKSSFFQMSNSQAQAACLPHCPFTILRHQIARAEMCVYISRLFAKHYQEKLPVRERRSGSARQKKKQGLKSTSAGIEHARARRLGILAAGVRCGQVSCCRLGASTGVPLRSVREFGWCFASICKGLRPRGVDESFQAGCKLACAFFHEAAS